MHSRTRKVSDCGLAVLLETEDDYESACLVFAEEASRPFTDDDYGLFFLVLLHVNAGSVACAAFDVDCSAAHCIACRVSDVSVNNNLSVVHRVAHRVLRVAVDRYCSAAEIGAERVSRSAAYCDILILHARSDEALSEAVINHAVPVRTADILVEL